MNNENKNKDELKDAIENFQEKPEKENGVKAERNIKNVKKDKKKRNFSFKGLLKSRAFKKGWLSTAVICVFIAAVIVLNMIVGVLSEKVPALSSDLTAENIYQLSVDTTDFLQTVDKDITIKVLASEMEYTSYTDYLKANTILKKYSQLNNHIKIEYVDLAANPTFGNDYPTEVIRKGNYIVECGDKYRMLEDDDLFEYDYDEEGNITGIKSINVENAVTTAILNVTTSDQTKVAFIEGFGSYSADEFKNALKRNNYNVTEVSLMTQDIDADVNTLVLFSPSADLSQEASDKIKKFLDNGGQYGKNLLYVTAGLDKLIETPVLDDLIKDWGMELKNGLALEFDTNYMLSSSSRSISRVDYNDESYTVGLKDPSLYMVGGYIRPIEIKQENMVSPLLITSESAKLLPFDADDKFNIENAETGIFTAAAVSSKISGDGTKANVVVFASPMSFYDEVMKMSAYNNSAYIINMMNIITEHADDGFVIDGKSSETNRLGIVVSQMQVLAVIFIGVIPFVILGVGFVIWIRRRNK